MKKNFYIVLLLSIFSFAQQPLDHGFENSDNRFSKAENEQAANTKGKAKEGGGPIHTGPGNPGETLPIDNHIPLLLLSGIVFMVVLTLKQRKIQS
ncbi:hypothetical protein SAMN05421847_2544 [Halpernia humi]|uniref:Uncharacterized protein n=1 Tax=Halpernia humi TaxID=493375 RepID=A0A1H6APB8_9FLAO|nr:hypothetical protein [Halpernia humi]SEG50563.1 hypothetical protein SAMN05421847_2544 [Halpernia humi]